MAHPEHPKCPQCGKALFKAMGPAKVKPTDPYNFCRNKACSLWGPGGIGKKKAKAPPPPKPEPPRPSKLLPPVATESKPVVLRKRRAIPASEAPLRPKENASVASARQKIRALVKTHGLPTMDCPTDQRVAVGLVLAILNQETGALTAANALIDEFRLDQIFGLQKFSR